MSVHFVKAVYCLPLRKDHEQNQAIFTNDSSQSFRSQVVAVMVSPINKFCKYCTVNII